MSKLNRYQEQERFLRHCIREQDLVDLNLDYEQLRHCRLLYLKEGWLRLNYPGGQALIALSSIKGIQLSKRYSNPWSIDEEEEKRDGLIAEVRADYLYWASLNRENPVANSASLPPN